MRDERDDTRLSKLMARWQAGDAGAFDEIHGATRAAVEGYLGRWLGAAAAADLAQETYVRVIEARRTFRPDMPFRPWLFAIARHVALDARRARRRRWSREVTVEELPEVPVAPPAEEHLNGARILAVLDTLPAEQREVVWLARVEGMTAAEIGRIVGASPGAVKVRLHRATAKLRALLGTAYEATEGVGP